MADSESPEREKPFLCYYCSKYFWRKDILIHQWCVHKRERPFSCDKCESRFLGASDYNDHKTRSHRHDEECEVCCIIFENIKYYKKHATLHSNQHYDHNVLMRSWTNCEDSLDHECVAEADKELLSSSCSSSSSP